MKLLSLWVFCQSMLIISSPIFGKTPTQNRLPLFVGYSEKIPAKIETKMKEYTWHKGCPVAINDLRYLHVSYYGFDQKPHAGIIIINKALSKEVIAIFAQLYQHRFPIERMQAMYTFKGNFVLVDGLQRLIAVRSFLNNDIKAFGMYYEDFEGHIPNNLDFIIAINNLKSRKQVLHWYIEINEGGIVHSKEEMDRVKRLLSVEKS